MWTKLTDWSHAQPPRQGSSGQHVMDKSLLSSYLIAGNQKRNFRCFGRRHLFGLLCRDVIRGIAAMRNEDPIVLVSGDCYGTLGADSRADFQLCNVANRTFVMPIVARLCVRKPRRVKPRS